MVISTQRVVLSYLLNPFWNHWLSLQSDWLSFKVINKISGKWKAKSHCVENFDSGIANFVVFLQKLCDFKMDLIKWQLNIVSCNFGLKSYLRFQIELELRARSILKSCVLFQTKLHSTQFNYHYKLNIEIWHLNASFAKISQFNCYHSLWIHRAFTGKLSPNVEVLFLSEGKYTKKSYNV